MATILDQEATIKTALVEIKALTVSGKQVTLALFRQLQEEALIDRDELRFNGTPWGRVNYHVDDCKGSGAHLHVVWQKGQELRRSIVHREEVREEVDDLLKKARVGFQSALLTRIDREEPVIEGHPASTWPGYGRSSGQVRVSLPGISVSMGPTTARIVYFYWKSKRSGKDDHSWSLAARNLVSFGFGTADYLDRACDEWIEYARMCQNDGSDTHLRYAKLYRELEALDQLFIAV